MDRQLKYDLERFAFEIRIATVETLAARGFGHIGGSLSIADALSVLYGELMRIDPRDPKWPERDKLVCSKGHAGPAVYATLAIKGFFPKDELKTLNRPGTMLPSHCDRNKTPGVDMTTGSLGQGASLACGMALGDMLRGRDSKTYLILGDGECDEGQVWEAAMFASAKKLTNMVWLVDWNKKQLDGPVREILDTLDLEKKFASFGFDAVTVNGNDVEALYEAMTRKSDRPLAIVMDTIKGKGIKQVEETASNHSMTENADVFDSWLSSLKNDYKAFVGKGAAK